MKHTNKYIYAFLLIAAFSNPIKADDSLSPNIKAIVKNSYDQDIKKFKKCVASGLERIAWRHQVGQSSMYLS